MYLNRGCQCWLLAMAAGFFSQGAFAQVTFQEGDRIALIGNGLPDRMQHDGWLETYLQAANPGKGLVIRNLGFTGDEVAQRPREESFPAPDFYLNHVKASVIFAFFGYNESFRHDPAKFKQELRAFIDDTRAKQYDGKATPRIVLFSPIAHEDLGSPNFPDGQENNLWLSVYTDAMARVAAEKEVPFVDLFAATAELYEMNEAPLTINGVHLNAEGNRQLADVILESLHQPVDREHLDLIRAAVLEKNWPWFNRYRATDGNDVWGNRSVLKFVDEQTNAEVLQHELVMLDLMTENRDRVIWNAIRGESSEPDDSNVPHPLLVKTNLTADGKTGSLEYLSPEETIKTFTMAQGVQASVFASEAMFPELVNPVQMDVDTKGRIWVAAWETYPKWQPDREMLDRLLILPDEDRDGVADKAITFAYVHNPTAFTFWNGGVIVASVPDLLFLKDTDGDDVADVREHILGGLDSADTHHSANNFDYGPDGYVYYQRGVFNVSNVETPWESAQLSGTPGMYRFNPRTHRFSFHAENSPNSHGNDFDYWGYHFATDATSGRAFQVHTDTGGKFKMREMLEKEVRPVPSSGILSSQHFPEEFNQNYLILNAIGFLGIKNYKLENKDGVVTGVEQEDMLVSSDPNFRPADFKVGDDGALYVADWCNAIIGHMQHNIRDPSRDHVHGRVFRLTVEGRELQKPVAIDGEAIPALLEVLKHPVDGVRLRARTELSERDSAEVLAAAAEWIQQFDGAKAEDAHHLLEALWLYQQHDVLNDGLLTVLLNSPEPHARRAAERVKYLWEIEGKLGAGNDAVANHMDHMQHMEEEALLASSNYLEQEKSPEPVMDGDTMVVHIQTLKEQMRYDRAAFAVAPGMKVRLEFSNPDAMDHNWVLTQPAAAAEVAMAAMMLGSKGIELDWLPKNDNILAASEMVTMGKSQTIEFTAPTEKAAYDYVCTFPGHYMLMNGIMHVVDDPMQWMADNADEPQSQGRKFVQDWKMGDFGFDITKLDDNRSLEAGEKVFQAASCVACHTPNATGGQVGPELAGLAERFDVKAMLVEMLEPSTVINEKFQSWQLELETEDAFEESSLIGLIVEENDETLRILTNPLQDTQGKVIEKARIKSRKAAPLSTMPTGLLNSFTKNEILDLMTYLRSFPAARP